MSYGRTVINAAVRASTYRALRPLGLPGACVILSLVAITSLWQWRRRETAKRGRKWTAEERDAWERRWYPERFATDAPLTTLPPPRRMASSTDR